MLGHLPDKPTPLGAAVLCDDPSAVEAALKAGESPNAREPGGETPLLYAAAIPRPAILKRLLAAGGDPNAWETDARTTALAYALSVGAAHDDWSAWTILLDNGADIDFRPPNGSTIAETTVSLGALAKLMELLDRGYNADLDQLARSLEVIRVRPQSEPLRQKAIERVRAMRQAKT